MKSRYFIAALIAAFAFPATAFAYVGPGAGLSLLGALWALVAAIAAAIVMIVAWPVRKMLRSRRTGNGRKEDRAQPPSQPSNPASAEMRK
ncbi:MAG: hypothetical protein AB7O39_03470 [Flavobacteriaceae bacterium]